MYLHVFVNLAIFVGMPSIVNFTLFSDGYFYSSINLKLVLGETHYLDRVLSFWFCFYHIIGRSGAMLIIELLLYYWAKLSWVLYPIACELWVFPAWLVETGTVWVNRIVSANRYRWFFPWLRTVFLHQSTDHEHLGILCRPPVFCFYASFLYGFLSCEMKLLWFFWTLQSISSTQGVL